MCAVYVHTPHAREDDVPGGSTRSGIHTSMHMSMHAGIHTGLTIGAEQLQSGLLGACTAGACAEEIDEIASHHVPAQQRVPSVPPTHPTQIGRAAGELAHVVTSQAVGRPQGECMRAFVGQTDLLESLGAVPDAIVVADALPPVVQGLDPGAPAGRVPDPGGLDWLPGMSFAHVGQPFMTNAFQVRPRSGGSVLCLPATMPLRAQAPHIQPGPNERSAACDGVRPAWLPGSRGSCL